MADLYSELGVPRTADAAAIKRAYRKLAKELHPDKNKDNPKAADRFKTVTAAYDILSDAEKKGKYDRGEIDEQGNPSDVVSITHPRLDDTYSFRITEVRRVSRFERQISGVQYSADVYDLPAIPAFTDSSGATGVIGEL